jgi:DNA-binding beta-propeller fold protein YncE
MTVNCRMELKTDFRIGGRLISIVFLSSLCVLSALYPENLNASGIRTSFLYKLSNFTGVIYYRTPRISVDRNRNEVCVLYQNQVRVFNENGMEIYRFGDDVDLGQLVDVAVDNEGNILILSYRNNEKTSEPVASIIRCDYRGTPVGRIDIKDLPAAFADFEPQRLVWLNNNIYMVSFSQLKIVITGPDGKVNKYYDLLPLLGVEEKNRADTEISGFNVDQDGSILFTVPVLFSAFRLYPDGRLVSFGKPGGAPGRFNVVGGIALDSQGNYLVVDRLKSTVQVFDPAFNFITQFGYRGVGQGNLIAPVDITIDKSDRIYVTQNGRGGVSVFKVLHD